MGGEKSMEGILEFLEECEILNRRVSEGRTWSKD